MVDYFVLLIIISKIFLSIILFNILFHKNKTDFKSKIQLTCTCLSFEYHWSLSLQLKFSSYKPLCLYHNSTILRWLKENKNVLITKITEFIHINVKIWYRKRVMQLAQVTKKNIEVLIRETVWNNSTLQHFILKCNYITHEAGCYKYNYHHCGKIRRLHISIWRSTPNPPDLQWPLIVPNFIS